jgi:anaerobic selenocysteine-containing dehydrogenase
MASNWFFSRLGASALSGSLCDDTGIAAQIEDFGDLDHNHPHDLANAHTVVVWGKDPARSSLHTHRILARARDAGTRVVHVGPGGGGGERHADQFIPLRPGCDRFLAAATLKLLSESNRLPETAATRAANYPALAGLLAAGNVRDWCEACGAAPKAAQTLAHIYGRAEPVATLMGWGLQRHPFGGQNVRFIDALCAASGQMGKPGAGAWFNVSSSRNLDVTWARPAPGPSRAFQVGLLARELPLADPPVEFIWVDGFNPVNQVPGAEEMARAFEATPFTVVVDAFANDTVARADVVLPCALSLEKEEILGSCLHDCVNYAAACIPPRGQARQDHEILRDLGKRLAEPVRLPDPETWLSRALDTPVLDTSLEEIRARGFARARRPAVAFAGLVFAHPDGRCRYPESLDPEPPPPPGYPLRLLTLVRGGHIHSQIPTAEQEVPPTLLVSARDQNLAGLDPEGETRLVTPRGRLTVRLEPHDTLVPGTAIIRRGGWMRLGAGANHLIEPVSTDMGGGTAYYAQYGRLEQD